MKLQESLPKGVRVGRRFYRLDLDFRNVLRMMEILQRDDLMPDAREYLALKCLTKHPRSVKAVLAQVKELLFPQAPSTDGKKIMSFEQDAGLIRTAFLQAYHIDLYHERLHWMQFQELLNNLPEGSRYSEVIGIRARPMPKATKYNAEERQWLLKAKASVALHMTDEEQAKKYDSDVSKVFAGLMNMFKGSENSG